MFIPFSIVSMVIILSTLVSVCVLNYSTINCSRTIVSESLPREENDDCFCNLYSEEYLENKTLEEIQVDPICGNISLQDQGFLKENLLSYIQLDENFFFPNWFTSDFSSEEKASLLCQEAEKLCKYSKQKYISLKNKEYLLNSNEYSSDDISWSALGYAHVKCLTDRIQKDIKEAAVEDYTNSFLQTQNDYFCMACSLVKKLDKNFSCDGKSNPQKTVLDLFSVGALADTVSLCLCIVGKLEEIIPLMDVGVPDRFYTDENFQIRTNLLLEKWHSATHSCFL